MDIIRAWKDEEFRRSLSEAQRRGLPAHPAGMIELTDAELENVAAGAKNQTRTCPTHWNCSRPGGCNSNGTGGGCTKLACCEKK